jgi:hypothetical protein
MCKTTRRVPPRHQRRGAPAPAASPARTLESLGCGARSDVAAFIHLSSGGDPSRPSSILPGRDRARDSRAQRGASWLPAEAGARLRSGGVETCASAHAAGSSSNVYHPTPYLQKAYSVYGYCSVGSFSTG